MFFVLSKLAWFVAAPANVFAALLAAGLAFSALGRPRLGAAALRTGAGALLVCGLSPLGTLLLVPLENRFPPLPPGIAAPDGIIVLGGAIDQVLGATRDAVTIVDAATRITEAVRLARRFPTARLVYTGGSASLVAEVGSEAADARRLWTDLGVDPGRVTIEERSRNTVENAQFSRALLAPHPGQRWVLVTSAYHMPRAMGLFRAAGFDAIPDPVDYRTTGTWRDLLPERDIGRGLAAFDFAVKEWVGLIAYRATDRIADLLPGP